MQTESTQPIEEAHAEAMVANDKVIAAEQVGGSIAGAEAVEEAKAEASGTLEQLKSDRETARLEAQKAFESSYTGVSDAMKLLDSTFSNLLKLSEAQPVESGAIVPDLRPNIPIAPEDVTPEMLASQAQREANAAMMGAAAESIQSATAAKSAEAAAPVDTTGLITEVPGVSSESKSV